MKNLNHLAFILCLASCSTVVHRTLPNLTTTEINVKKNVLLEFEDNLDDRDQDFLLRAIKLAGVENNMRPNFIYPRVFKPNNEIKKFKDFFPQPAAFASDLKIRLSWQSFGFFHPYCILFLTALPCTPPIEWTLAARVYDKDGKFLKDYAVNEKALGIYWLGFLNPTEWGKPDEDELLMANAFKNLMAQLKADQIL